MRIRIEWDRWAWPLGALAFGAIVFGLSAAKGRGLELL